MSTLNKQTKETIEIDIAVIGGGSAGITLASKLSNLSALVIEPRTPLERDCSWALWANTTQTKTFASSTKGSWKQWRLIDHYEEILHNSEQFSYTSLSSASYMAECENSLSDGVNLVRAAAKNIVAAGDGGSFTAAGQNYSAAYLYDSRPPKMATNSLKQHFLGWEIRTKSPIDKPEIATLMDFRVDQSRGLHFIYALPFSSNHILIESTMISTNIEDKTWYRQAIEQWLQQQNIEIDELLGEEVGVIPMQAVTPTDKSIACIGAASGAVRLSSGYAFSGIQQQVNKLAQGINRGNHLVPAPISPGLIRMDEIFNRVLMAQPELGVTIMMKTAKALSADSFAHFMLGTATWLDWLKVILAMPKLPFLKQVFSQ